MASRSPLRINQGLLWDAQNPVTTDINHSYEFIILNSIWKLKIDLKIRRDAETNDIYDVEFNINMCNISVLEPLQPFEVTTFLEDKKNNAQMKCSRHIVISSYVNLFKGSFNSLFKKLPGLNICDEIIILFLFSAPTDVGLNLKRDDDSPTRLSIVPCLVWETSKPPLWESRESAVFSLMSSSWKLKLFSVKFKLAFHSAYQVSLYNTSTEKSYCPFDVKIFLEHTHLSIPYKQFKLEDESSSSETFYQTRFDSILLDVPELSNYDDITIICIFSPLDELRFSMEVKYDNNVLLRCVLCQNEGCFHQDISPGPSSRECSSVKTQPNIVHLSQDLSQLMEKHFMADMQLKCKERLIPAHKSILAARSVVFLAKIKEEMDGNNTVDVSAIEPLVIDTFIRYLYSGEIPDVLSDEMIYHLYEASSLYAVTSLQQMCRCYLSRNINEKNFVDILMLASFHSDIDLKSAGIFFMSENPVILLNKKWLQLEHDFPELFAEIKNKVLTMARERCNKRN